MKNQPSTASCELRHRRLKPKSGHRSERLCEDAWKAIGQSLKLSGRELAIVRGVFEDRTEMAIAADLGISPHTVHTHFERLHHKLTITNRVQLVLRVMDELRALTVAPGSKLAPLCARWHAGTCPLNRATP